ncbi:hypothetical protein GA0115246_1082721 [Streptomyces sp. SolWspMP-sol7th]|nr:hypothetical protein GA0115246_1082721 [Streptomyces sp. SolWspMP-sol7th]
MPDARPETPAPATTPVPDLLAFLAGRWHVARTAEDRHTGTRGHFTGTADFTALPGGGLRHHEEGTFTWDGVARPAYRTLRWLPDPAGKGSARVTFDDGRFFHDVDLRTGHAIADHPCSLDLVPGRVHRERPGPVERGVARRGAREGPRAAHGAHPRGPVHGLKPAGRRRARIARLPA